MAHMGKTQGPRPNSTQPLVPKNENETTHANINKRQLCVTKSQRK